MKLKLKQLCEKKGVTIYQLSNKLNVDRNTVYAWSNNNIFPRVKQLDKLIEYFDCNVEDLIEKN
jgi:transcriptional regulator with XRE-family HTH domain